MAYEPKEGAGALFKNDKGENPARPDYRGDIMLGGVLYEVSGWIKPLPSDACRASRRPSVRQRRRNVPRQSNRTTLMSRLSEP
jgi:hypothetical protein